MRGRNTNILHYYYRVNQEIGKVFSSVFRIPYACTSCVAPLDKYWLATISPSSQPRYDHVEIVDIQKYLNITIIGSSCNSYTTRHPKLSSTKFMH